MYGERRPPGVLLVRPFDVCRKTVSPLDDFPQCRYHEHAKNAMEDHNLYAIYIEWLYCFNVFFISQIFLDHSLFLY